MRALTDAVNARHRLNPWYVTRPDGDAILDAALNAENYAVWAVAMVRQYFADGWVLDLGSGAGGVQVALQKAGYRSVGIEPNLTDCNVAALRGQLYGGSGISQAVGEALPFPASTFCADVLEHVQDIQLVLNEIKRTLKPNGIAYVTLHNRWSFFPEPHYRVRFLQLLPGRVADWLVQRLGRVGSTEHIPQYVRLLPSQITYLSWDAAVDLLHGFTIEDVRYKKLQTLEYTGAVGGILRFVHALHLFTPFYLAQRQFGPGWGLLIRPD